MKEREETPKEKLNQVRMIADMRSQKVKKQLRKRYQTTNGGILIRN